jgi:hypothetical protein
MVLGEAGEDLLNAGVVAGLNNDLDSAILDLSKIHEELEDAHARQHWRLNLREEIHQKLKFPL